VKYKRTLWITVLLAVMISVGAAPSLAQTLPFQCTSTSHPFRTLSDAELPYNGGAIVPLVDTLPHDSDGVRMYVINGKLYDHPVQQASYGFQNLYAYSVTSNSTYLSRAEAQAGRLIDRKVTSRGAWYFPYPFSFALHGNSSDTLKAPWYSAMAQGMALGLFVRLYKVTNDAQYLNAAQMTFQSFLNLASSSAPWTSQVDSAGYLWLQEYPGTPSDNTFNGHNFAIFGLYDYYALTHDAIAQSVMDCALTTVQHYITSFRNKAWISFYCLTHHVMSSKYHAIHIAQLLQFYTFTGTLAFASDADDLSGDYPNPAVAGPVTFAAGTVTGYSFDRTGKITGKKSLTLTRASGAPASGRYRIHTQYGYWYHITKGYFAGYWVREVPVKVFLTGSYQLLTYDPARNGTVKAGTYTGYRFSSGRITATKKVTFTTVTAMPYGGSAFIDAQQYLSVSDGELAGYWVLKSSFATLR
jgi:D-glucuronyl C5-epimerase-like protein